MVGSILISLLLGLSFFPQAKATLQQVYRGEITVGTQALPDLTVAELQHLTELNQVKASKRIYPAESVDLKKLASGRYSVKLMIEWELGEKIEETAKLHVRDDQAPNLTVQDGIRKWLSQGIAHLHILWS